MTQAELPLKLDPYPGYWRVTVQYKWGRPPETRWFAYEDKHIAKEWASSRPDRPHISEMVLDTEFDPAAFENPDEEREYMEWY